MRRSLTLCLSLLLSAQVGAMATYRVGQQVLTRGDTAVHVIELLGTPSFKEPITNEYGAYIGERWQYLRDGDRVVIVTLIGGRVADIDDRAS